MKKLIHAANEYKSQMTLVDISLFKVCLMSMGVLVGITIPKSYKKKAATCASIAFVFTYAPLMTKFLAVVLKESSKEL